MNSRFSKDDSKIFVVTSDEKVTVYDLAEKEPKQLMQAACFFPAKNSFSQTLVPQFSDDDSKLFVRTSERRIHIFESTSGEQVGQPIVTGTALSIALSPDQRHCATGGDSYARIQSINWNQNIPTFIRFESRLSHDDEVTNVVFGGNKLIATAGRDRLVQIWNIGEEKPPGVLLHERAIPLATIAHTDNLVGLLFPNDGNLLVSLQRDGLIRVWQMPSFDPPGYSLTGTPGGTTIKAVDSEQLLIAGSTYIGSKVVNASLRRLKDGVVVAETQLRALKDRGYLLDACLTTDRSKLISLHANPSRNASTLLTNEDTAGSIQVWEFPDCRPIGPCISVNAEPRSVVLHPNKSMAAVLLVNRDVLLIDLEETGVSRKLISKLSSQPLDSHAGVRPINLHNGQVRFSTDGNLIFAWGIGKGFSVWDSRDERPCFSSEFAEDWIVSHLAISPKGDCIAVVNDDTNRVALIDIASGAVGRELEHAAKIRSVEFSSSGTEILTACDDGRARIISVLPDDRKSIDFVHNKKVLRACYSPDLVSVATLTSDMRVFVWRVSDRQWAMKPMPVPKGTQELLFSPDSNYLIATGTGKDYASKILDLSSFHGTRELDLEYVTRLGELLSAKSNGDGAIVNLTSTEWLTRWAEFESMFLK